MKIMPLPGRVVRDPESYVPLPPEGAEVEPTEYWMRRLADGDVMLKPAVSAAKNKKSSKGAAE